MGKRKIPSWTESQNKKLCIAVDTQPKEPQENIRWRKIRDETPSLQKFNPKQLRTQWIKITKRNFRETINNLQEQIYDMENQIDYFFRFFEEYNFELHTKENMK